MSEARIEALLTRLVRRELGGYALKFVSSETGVPDRVVTLPGGRVVFLELKAPGGSRSPKQRVWGDRLERLDVEYAVLGSETEVRRWIASEKARYTT